MSNLISLNKKQLQVARGRPPTVSSRYAVTPRREPPPRRHRSPLLGTPYTGRFRVGTLCTNLPLGGAGPTNDLHLQLIHLPHIQLTVLIGTPLMGRQDPHAAPEAGLMTLMINTGIVSTHRAAMRHETTHDIMTYSMQGIITQTDLEIGIPRTVCANGMLGERAPSPERSIKGPSPPSQRSLKHHIPMARMVLGVPM